MLARLWFALLLSRMVAGPATPDKRPRAAGPSARRSYDAERRGATRHLGWKPLGDSCLLDGAESKASARMTIDHHDHDPEALEVSALSSSSLESPDTARKEAAIWPGMALVVTIATLAAGTAEAKAPRLGWEVGIARSSFAYVGDRGPIEDNGRWLLRAGVTAIFEFPSRIRMTPSFAYVERGAANRVDGPYFSEDQTIRERSLALGLLWGRPLFRRLVLVAGLEAAYLLEGVAKGTYTSASTGRPGESGRVDYRFDYTEWADRVDILGKVGLEFELPFAGHGLALQGHYLHGITEQSRAGNYSSGRSVVWTGGPPFAMTTSRTRAVELGIGFRW